MKLIAIALLFASCGRPSSTSPTLPAAELAPEVLAGFPIGQRSAEAYVGAAAYSVTPERFRWIPRPPEFFRCGDDPNLKQGCFWPDPKDPRVEWSHPDIIGHESAHAILWALGDKRWPCIGHDDPSEPLNFLEECRR